MGGKSEGKDPVLYVCSVYKSDNGTRTANVLLEDDIYYVTCFINNILVEKYSAINEQLAEDAAEDFVLHTWFPPKSKGSYHRTTFDDLHVTTKDIGGVLIKDTDQYRLYDNKTLNNLCLSKTELRPSKSTNGHRHAGQEEVYIFTNGEGRMEVDHREFKVKKGDIVLIPDNAFHKVQNTGDFILEFVCVFDGKRKH